MSSKLLTFLATALLISALANIWGGYTLRNTRQALSTANTALAVATGNAALAEAAAQACSASVADLAEQAATQALANLNARESAQARADQRYTAADRILATGATAPGNDCASAQARVSAILAARQGGGS